MANISGNINKANNHIWPQLIKHKEDIWRWKSTSWFDTGTQMWWG